MTTRQDDIRMRRTVPILRMFDAELTKQFYIGFLGFRLDWEHRFEDGLPLYMQLSFGGCTLHLSEHFGDATPGAAVRVEISGIAAYHAKLLGQSYKYARPGLEKTPWNTTELSVQDPAGNRIHFYETDEER
ncbi:glyoxalase superfamily protein [Paenibacillus sp. GYB003]|uniref:glyoxalase superfamily protein n=1 Tax=Paenibacillus sp. GYB003 TaxID=2994392 RepID=UPI002F9679C5